MNTTIKRNGVTLTRGKTPIIYLSGRFSAGKEERPWIRRTGCRYRCFSYAYVYPEAFYYREPMELSYKISLEEGCHVFMDSSAHSFHKFMEKSAGGASAKLAKNSTRKHENVEKFRENVISQYVSFCKSSGNLWDFYVNFDYVRHCPTIYAMQERLEGLGLKPVPVYHGDESLDWFRRYIDAGHRLIGIGSILSQMDWQGRMAIYDRIFNIAEKHGVLLHGFAVTSISLMLAFPWFSVDSSTWVRASAYGSLIMVDPIRRVIGQVHVTPTHTQGGRTSYKRMQPEVQKQFRRMIEGHGFDFEKIRHSLEERSVYNGWVFSNLDKLGPVGTSKERTQWERLL